MLISSLVRCTLPGPEVWPMTGPVSGAMAAECQPPKNGLLEVQVDETEKAEYVEGEGGGLRNGSG